MTACVTGLWAHDDDAELPTTGGQCIRQRSGDEDRRHSAEKDSVVAGELDSDE